MAPLPDSIQSAAAAHLNLRPWDQRRFLGAFSCHIDEPPHHFPGGLKQMVSSHAGPLRKLLLTIPNYVVREDALAAIFCRLPIVLPRDTHFVILTNANARATVERWFDRDDHRACYECQIISIDDEVTFTMWAEDPYAVGMTDAYHSAFIEPQQFQRNADDMIASLIAARAGFERVGSPLIFQGGNVLIGDSFYLVGADYLLLSWQQVFLDKSIDGELDQPSRRALREIQRDFLDPTRQAHFIGCNDTLPAGSSNCIKLPVGPNGAMVNVSEDIQNGSKENTVQPLFHIDMFVTLVGRESNDGPFRILVGDPRYAAEILGIDLPDHALASAFDEIARKLAVHDDFEVSRNPLPYVYVDFQRKKDKSYHRWWYYASANNAIVERRETEQPRIWLPSFGFNHWSELAVTDAENCRIWEALGFDVTMMPNCHALAQNLGGAHCIKKYLAR